jgi:predicted amidohydrolase YtcJ
VREGNALQSQPWTVVVGAEYRTAVGEHEVYARGDYNYRGGQMLTSGRDPLTSSFSTRVFDPEGTNTVNVRVGMEHGKLDLSLFATNLFNDHPALTHYSESGDPVYRKTTLTPRTLGITAGFVTDPFKPIPEVAMRRQFFAHDLSGVAASLLLCSLPATSAAQSAQVANVVIVNGKVYSADGSGTFQEAVAIRGGRVLAVGKRNDIARLIGAKTETIDAKGGAVTPGLIDTHVHLMIGAKTLDIVDANRADAAELQRRIREYMVKYPDRPWIEGFGYLNRAITRLDLDPVTGDKPGAFRDGDAHSVLVNTAALRLAKIDRNTPDPAGGKIERDPRTGEATGRLLETAQSLVYNLMPQDTKADRERLLALGTRAALAAGVTTVVNIGGADDLELLAAARDRRTLGLRVYSALWLSPGAGGGLPEAFAFTPADADKFDAIGRRYRSDNYLKVGMVKIMLDGVIESHTAAILQPYSDQPTNRGSANYSPAELNAAVKMMDARGWQIITHAIGDRAVRMALDAFQEGQRTNPAWDRRHKIEHIESIDPVDMPRFAELGVTASIQQAHSAGMADPRR